MIKKCNKKYYLNPNRERKKLILDLKILEKSKARV